MKWQKTGEPLPVHDLGHVGRRLATLGGKVCPELLLIYNFVFYACPQAGTIMETPDQSEFARQEPSLKV